MEETAPTIPPPPEDILTPQDTLEHTNTVSVTPMPGTSLEGTGLVVQAPPVGAAPVAPVVAPSSARRLPEFLQNRQVRKVATLTAIVLGLIIILVAGVFFYQKTHKTTLSAADKLAKIKDQTVALSSTDTTAGPASLRVGVATLFVNGDLSVQGVLRFSNGDNHGQFDASQITSNQTYSLPNASGTICLDSNNCGYTTSSDLSSALQNASGVTSTQLSEALQNVTSSVKLTAGPGIDIQGQTISNTGVISVNGSSDAVTIQGTNNQVVVTNNGGVISLGLPQDIAPTSVPIFSSLNLTGIGTQNGGHAVCDNSNNCGYAVGVNSLLQGGNGFGTDVIVGANDNNGLKLITNNTTRLTITNNGLITLGGANSDRINAFAQFSGNKPLVFQGATDDFFTTSLVITNPTSNRNIILPNADGTVCLSAGNCSGSGGYGDVLNGGNNYNSNMSLGTTDNYSLTLKTKNLDRIVISNSGLTTLLGNVTSAADTILGSSNANRLTINSQILGNTALVFQGATDNSFSTSFVVTDPTANRTITLPNADGTICLSSGNCSGLGGTGDVLQGGNNFGGTMTLGTNDNFGFNLKTNGTNRLTISNVGSSVFTGSLAVNGDSSLGVNSSNRITINSQILGGTPLVFQGATDNSFSTTLIVTDPTANRNITLPNADGTICLSIGNCSSGGSAGDILNNGNSFNGPVTLGTNDNFGLNLKTDNTNRLTISNAGLTTVLGNFIVDGDTLLGNSSANSVSIQATNLFAPNDLNIDNYTQYIDTANDKVGFGTLPLGTARVSILSTTGGDALTVNNGSSSGNILNLQDNGTNVVTVANGGVSTFRNSADTTAAFLVQNAAGASIVSVDTTNRALSVNGGQNSYVYTPTGPILNSGSSVTTAARPFAVTYGNLNGDAYADMITANNSADSISVMMNNGDGTFANKVDYPTNAGGAPLWLASGDFNGDGRDDVVVSNYYNDVLSVLINNGNGTFAAKVDYPAPSRSYGVTVADLNNDNIQDIAITGANGVSFVSVLIGNGNGTFAAKVDYPAPSAVAISATDVNNDGFKDLVTADSSSNQASVYINNGNGTFATKVDYASGIDGEAITSGDFNGDGWNDFAVAAYGEAKVAVHLNNGNGTFASKVMYATGTQPAAIRNVDYNGDGFKDLVVSNYGSSSLSLLLGNGNGTFGAKTDTALSGQPGSISVTDYNGDGKPDASVSMHEGSSVQLLLGNGTSSIVKNSLSVAPITAFDTALYIRAAAGQTSDIIRVTDSFGSNAILSLSGSGALSLKNVNDSTAAFQIQNTTGTNLLTADSLNGKIQIGTASDDIATLFVVDNNGSLTSGDPAGVNGAMYYNGNTNKFRCYQNGAWANCVGADTPTLQTTYGFGNTITTTDGRDIAITLADTTTDANLTVTTAAGSAGFTTFALADGTNASPAAQLVLIKNNDLNQSIAAGLSIQSATGGIVTAFDASGSNITNALSIGANAIAGTNFNVSGAGLVTLAGGQANGDIVTANGAAPNSLTVKSGNSTSANGSGGAVSLVGGFGNGTGAGGLVSLQGGAGGATGTGGSVTITSGNGGSTSGNSGNLTLSVGSVTSGTVGTLTVGNSTATNTINIGNLAGNAAIQTVNVGASATAGSTTNVTIGSLIGASTTTLQAGSTGRVQIGSTGDSVATLLVVDSATSDPTGVNGAIYYNSSTFKFRCYQNGAWTNCAGAAGAGTGDVLGTGNTYGGTMTLGTLDAQTLNIITNNVNRLSFNSTGGITLQGGPANTTGNGGTINITAQAGGSAAANNTGVGGAINITAGAGTANNNAGGALTLASGAGHGAQPAGTASLLGGTGGSSSAGGAIVISAGSGGTVSGQGGAVSISTGSAVGSSSNSPGGALSLSTGAGVGSGNGGAISITAGSSVSGSGGGITIQAGTAGASGVNNGGNILIQAGGSGGFASGGTTTLRSGNGTSFGSAGALFIQGGSAAGTDVSGTNITISGSQGTGTGVGGNILFQVAKAGNTGTSLNGLATVATISGADGSILFKNSSNTTSALQVQNAAGTTFFNLDSTNSRVGIGTVTPGAALEVAGNVLLSSGADRILSVAPAVSGNGNKLTIQAGAASSAAGFTGGDLELRSGGVGGISGSISIATANTTGVSGNVNINTAPGGVAAGNIVLQTGSVYSVDFCPTGINTCFGSTSINASGGRVNIGTATSNAKLSVVNVVSATNYASDVVILGRGGSGQTGDLLQLQDGTPTTLFSVSSTGNVLTKTSANSSTAFQIQNSSSTPIFTADTTNSRLQVGNTSADSAATLLVLDTKNTTGDPTGVNGASYYNSFTNKFRCYENGAWTNCVGGSGAGSGDVTQGGNSFGTALTLGTTDNFALNLNTNNTTRLTISNTGAVAIAATGTAGTVEKFRVGTATTVDNTANSILSASALGAKALVVQGAASQTASLQEWQTSTGSILGSVSASGVGSFVNLLQNGNQVCDNSNNCGYITSAGFSLQTAYNASTNPEIVLGAGATKGITIRDNATPIAANLFEVQNNAGTISYFKVDANGIAVTGSASVTNGLSLTGGDLNVATGKLQVAGVDRIDNSGNLVNVTFNGNTIGVGYGGTGATSLTANGILYGNGTGAIQATAAGTSGQCLIAGVGSVPTWGSCAAVSGNVNQGGNNFGSDVTIGATDNYGINLLANNVAVARFSNSGQAAFQNGSDSATALQIQNAAGTSLFTVDSTNSRIYVGNPTADSTGTILVLDTKNTAGDPTGIDGAMYYNSNLSKFRCYESGAWKDCIYSLQTASKTADQTFSATTYANVNDLSFSVLANKVYKLQCSLLLSVPSGTNGGNISTNGPASPSQYTATFAKSLDQSSGDNYATSSTFDDGSSATTFKVNTVSTGSNRFIVNFNALLINGANSGTWTLRSKAFDGSSSLTMYANSSCDLKPI